MEDREQTAKRAPGRPAWEPTPEERAKVQGLAASGLSVDDIAELMGKTAPTIHKHCKLELLKGRALGRVANTKRLIAAANAGKVAAMIWLDKTRFGVREDDEEGKKMRQAREAEGAAATGDWGDDLEPRARTPLQ